MMNADGSGETQVTRWGRFQLTPSWSPDGDSLAIAGDWGHYPALSGDLDHPRLRSRRRHPERGAAGDDVPRRGSRSRNRQLRPRAPVLPRRELDRVHAVQGPQLSAIYRGHTASAIYRVGIDGSGLERLTPWRLDASDPDWSPDGQRIAFDSGWGYTRRRRPDERQGQHPRHAR